MANKTEKTIVVFRTPGRPLVCIRASDLPVPLDIGQVYDFGGILFQQTHKAIVCIGRTERGTTNDADSMLKSLVVRIYGEAGLAATLAHATVNFSAVSSTNERTAQSGIRIGVSKLLADDGEDLVFVPCRVVNGAYLREELSDSAGGALSATKFGLAGPDFESGAAKPIKLAADVPAATTAGAAKPRRKRIKKSAKTS